VRAATVEEISTSLPKHVGEIFQPLTRRMTTSTIGGKKHSIGIFVDLVFSGNIIRGGVSWQNDVKIKADIYKPYSFFKIIYHGRKKTG
jgi:hypothetical protein